MWISNHLFLSLNIGDSTSGMGDLIIISWWETVTIMSKTETDATKKWDMMGKLIIKDGDLASKHIGF